MKETQRLVKLLFYIVDRITNLRLSQNARLKAEKNRKEAERNKMKQIKDE